MQFFNSNMARNNKVSMPTSTAGLTRFYDEYRSKIQFKPEHLVILIIVVVILHLMLHALG